MGRVTASVCERGRAHNVTLCGTWEGGVCANVSVYVWRDTHDALTSRWSESLGVGKGWVRRSVCVGAGGEVGGTVAVSGDGWGVDV